MACCSEAGWASNEFFAAIPGAIPDMTRFQPGNQSANEVFKLIGVWIVQLG
jgi:hypothetical protein